MAEKRRLFVSFVLIVALVAVGCGGGTDAGDEDGGSDTDAQAELKELTINLGWKANGTYAPMFLAQEAGYFAEEGLDVKVQEGGPGIGPEMILTGQRQFMIATVDDIPFAAEQSLDLVSVGVIAQQTPSCVAVLGDSGIEEPTDLAGKTVGFSEGGQQGVLLDAFLINAGVDPSDVKRATLAQGATVPALLAGRVDATAEFTTDSFILIQREDPSARCFMYSDYGVEVLSTGIITSREIVENDPEMVEGFVRATLRAYEEAKENPGAAIEAAAETYPDSFTEVELETAKLEAILELMDSSTTAEFGPGYTTDEQWTELVRLLTEYAGLKAGSESVDAYYTNEFLPS